MAAHSGQESNTAAYDKFLILDSDGSHPTKYIPELYKKFMTGRYDVVIGSRYVGGGQTNDKWSSKVMSHILNGVFRICIGVTARDISTDYRMYNTVQLKKIKLSCENYDVLQEVLLKLKLSKKIGSFALAKSQSVFKRECTENPRDSFSNLSLVMGRHW